MGKLRPSVLWNTCMANGTKDKNRNKNFQTSVTVCSRKDICISFSGLKLNKFFPFLLMLESCLSEMNVSSYIFMEVHLELKCVMLKCFAESRCK